LFGILWRFASFAVALTGPGGRNRALLRQPGLPIGGSMKLHKYPHISAFARRAIEDAENHCYPTPCPVLTPSAFGFPGAADTGPIEALNGFPTPWYAFSGNLALLPRTDGALFKMVLRYFVVWVPGGLLCSDAKNPATVTPGSAFFYPKLIYQCVINWLRPDRFCPGQRALIASNGCQLPQIN
jgi:hypothetical protein